MQGRAGDREGRPYGELQEVRWGGTMWASSPTEAYLEVRRGGALPLPRAGKSAKRCRWQRKRAGFEEVPRLAATTVAGNRLARRWAREPRPYECDTRGATGGQRRPPLRMRYKRCGEVWNPPVTASPCQPPLGKGARGTGVADCHSQCAHWLRNDSFLHGVWCMAGGRAEGSAPTDTFIANCQWPVA